MYRLKLKVWILGQWLFWLPINLVLVTGASIIGILLRIFSMPYELLQAIAYDELQDEKDQNAQEDIE